MHKAPPFSRGGGPSPVTAATDSSHPRRLIEALSRIEVHVPFETQPIWQPRELDIRVGPRWLGVVERSDALERYGLNLANAYQQLRNLGDDIWSRVLDRERFHRLGRTQPQEVRIGIR
jgi:hypothetical protein